MKKILLPNLFIPILTLMLFNYSNAQHLPGSGNTLRLNGLNNYVEILNSASLNPPAYTIECWVKILSNTGTTGGANSTARYIVFKQRPTTTNFEYIALAYYVGGYFAAVTTSNIQVAIFTPANFVSFNKWYHLAVSADDKNLSLYVNGVLIGSKPTGFSLDPGSKNLYIGRSNEPAFEGFCNMNIDEVRFWDSVLPEKQIRDWMCKTVTQTHPSYPHLVSYYRFDQSGSTALNDATGNNNGTIFNNPTWIKSGAAIGNASAYTYGGSSVRLKISDSENIKVDKITGSPAGIQLYRVDNAPSIKKGIKGLGPNKTYFGVFPFGDSLIKYRTTYTYTSNPYVIQANEDSLKLYSRTSNSDSTWANTFAKLDTAKNTLITRGDSSKEYILGSSGVPLQVPKSVSINDTAVNEGNTGTKTLKVTVRLNSAAVFKSAVNYTTADSTAKAGEDYVKKTGTINFAVGQLTDTIRISIKGDTKVEANEIFKVLLNEPVNISIADTLALVTIKNDDGADAAISEAKQNDNLLTNKSSFSVSPNPAKDFINIISSQNVTDAQVRVTDMSGKTLFTAKQNFVAGQLLKVSLPQFPKAALILTIISSNGHEQFKIIKE